MPIEYKPGALIDPYQQWINETFIAPLTGDDYYCVTRGHDTALGQIETIAKLSWSGGSHWPEFDPNDPHKTQHVEIDGELIPIYTWMRTYVELCGRGYIVSPPFTVTMPIDCWIRGKNRKGTLIHASPHIVPMSESPAVRPCPEDWSARINRYRKNERTDILAVAGIMEQAKKNGAPIRNITVEPKNGCVHLDFEKKKEAI